MNKEVVLDIETQNTFQEVGGYDHSKLKISVIGCYFYETDTYETFEEHELPKLWPRLEHADRIIGYNTNGFDLPVMNNYYSGNFMTFPGLTGSPFMHVSIHGCRRRSPWLDVSWHLGWHMLCEFLKHDSWVQVSGVGGTAGSALAGCCRLQSCGAAALLLRRAS